MDTIKLREGLSIPTLGYGPDWVRGMPGYRKKRTLMNRVINKFIITPKYINAVSASINNGFRLIDFSASYGTGELIAKAINKSTCSRKDLVLTTRISNTAQFNNSIEKEFETQLKGFGVEYFDILMFHWPVTGHYEDTWLKMIELKKKGLCKILGVSNCNIHHLQKLYEISGEYPEINQVEIHPLFTQKELIRFCQDNSIQVQAYSPTARQDDRLVNPRLLKEMAKKYEKSITQLILRWHYQNKVIPIIRSMNPEHLKSNSEIFDFVISDDDMAKIDALNINSRMRYDPDNCDFHSL